MTRKKVEYLIDSSILIEAQKTYPQRMFPQVWEQLAWGLSKGMLHFIPEVLREIQKGNDDLGSWINSINVPNRIKTRSDAQIVERYGEVIRFIANSSEYNDKALILWSDNEVADPWLIATAMCYGHKIVTYEKPAKTKGVPCGKPKIPDICRDFNICCIKIIDLLDKIIEQMHEEATS